MADIYLIDDHAMFRDGLRAVLEKAGHRIVGESGWPEDAIADLEGLDIEAPGPVVLLDLHLEHRSGFEVLEEAQRRQLPARFIAITLSENPRHVANALKLGASGYMLKDSASAELLRAVEAVVEGRRYLCKRASVLAVQGLIDKPDADSLDTLSARERQVILMVVRGQTSAAIASQLDISPKTVESYRSRIMTKLGVSDVPALVRLAVREGLVDVDE